MQWWRHLIPTHGNWFQTNPLKHESDDHADNTVSSVYVTNGKDMTLQLQIWSRFVTVLWFCKTNIPDWTGTLVLVRVLWDMISKIYWQFWHSFFKNTFENSYNCYPVEIMWRKMVRSLCLKPVSIETWCLHTLWHFTVPAYAAWLGIYWGLFSWECCITLLTFVLVFFDSS